ncbi:MAG: hypothetical protein ACYDBB_07850 [Armatimonadota bacterium]
MRLLFLSLFLLAVSWRLAAEPLTLVITGAQTAGIDGRAWDKSYPGAMTMDAAQRSVLLRFPGAAEQIAAKLKEGYAVEKAEVVLTYNGFELAPDNYILRSGGMVGGMKANPPRWHVLAWPLRKPWQAQKDNGPTYNAYINGAGYWTKFGAADPVQDRFPAQFGPAELSVKQTEARLDMTPILTQPAYGKSLGARLRVLDEQGLLLRKLETYDHHYDEWWSSYEWATPTAGNGLTFKEPKLVLTLKPARENIGALPASVDITTFAQQLVKNGTGGRPTAVMPSPEELKAMAGRHAMSKPAWMPDWQWQRTQELRKIGGGVEWAEKLESGDPKKYAQVIDREIMITVPRYWKGWGVQDDLLLWYLYKDMLPGPAQDNIKAYWDSWLMPDRSTDSFFHAQSIKNTEYVKETDDWRGRKSFFRGGYNYVISTMNFNHTAAMGALLGGSIIGSDRAIADGRHGLEYLPLRLWAWYDGTTQESIDHYYFSITLSGQKMFADFGPTEFDRLMGQSILAKSVEELTSSYHPGLRRFVNTSGRTGMSFLWVTQGGLEHIVHTLSHNGTLHDVGNKDDDKMNHYDYNAPAGRIALQTLPGPWAPEWAANMVDEKPLPYQMTSSAKEWGHFAETPLWKRNYLGHHYGMASIDVPRAESVPAMVQWKRVATPVQSVQDTGTLLMRYTNNTPVLLTEEGGCVVPGGGSLGILQHKNKMLLLSSPQDMRIKGDSLHNADPAKVTSLQTTLALFCFQQQPTWELYVDDQRVTQLPVSVKAGQRITLKDGVSYLGLIPLPSTNLGRDAEVVISADAREEELQGGGRTKPSILINQYNYKSTQTVAAAGLDPAKVDQAYGGFLVEASDVTEYPTFAAFQQHLASAKVKTQWNEATRTLDVACQSGNDTLEVGYKPEYQVYSTQAVPTTECFTKRTVNGQWPYMAKGLDRDSNLTQQGTTGRLEKNGAVITCEPGRMAYLQTEPITGTYAAFNPLPDPTLFAVDLPGGVNVKADGRVGLLRLIVRPKENKVWVNYGVKADQQTPDMATTLLVFGLTGTPTIERNGKLMVKPATVKVNGHIAYLIPLADAAVKTKGLEQRCRRAITTLAALHQPASRAQYVHDWYIVGPFPNKDDMWIPTVTQYGPEKGFDANATYTGMDRVDGKEIAKPVRWQRIAARTVLGDGPVLMDRLLTPGKGAGAYACTKIISDRQRTVTFLTGGDQGMELWLNGKQVLSKHVFRASAPDQDKVTVTLKKGENTVLLHTMCAWEGWSFYFRIADEYGLPVTEGLTLGAGEAK